MKTRSGPASFRGAMVMAAASLGVSVLDLVAMAKWPVHDTPGIVCQMIILVVALAQLVPVAGFVAVGLALRSSPDQRGPKVAFWIWSAVALPILYIGVRVGVGALQT